MTRAPSPTASPMLPHVHDHIGSELLLVARTDTVFIIVAVVFNLIILAINAGVAGSAGRESALGTHLVFWALLVGTFLITATSVRALRASAATRATLIQGLARLYQDEGIDRYYDGTVAHNYAVRTGVFSLVIGVLGGLAILVPLFQYLLG